MEAPSSVAYGFNFKKILLVDDDQEFNTKVYNHLNKAFPEIEIIVVRDGSIAVDKFREHQPAVIILDMMLPGRSGFLVLEKIKPRSSHPEWHTQPPIVIMVTGNPGARHKQYAKTIGVWRYLTKPYETKVEKLENAVADALALVGANIARRKQK